MKEIKAGIVLIFLILKSQMGIIIRLSCVAEQKIKQKVNVL